MKKILFRVVLAGAVVLIAAIVARGLTYESRQMQVEPAPEIAIDTMAVAERLAGALRFETISHQDSAAFPAEEFLGFHAYLEESFPTLHATLEREAIGGYSLLYRWEGADANLRPVLFMAHMDVVPVESGTESEWTYPAFAGRVADGYVWGRGALDDKGTLVTQLEAIELLLSRGFQPQRTVYLAFGHDEEVGGMRGAARIASVLKQRGVQLEYVLDEGGIVTDAVTAVAAPVALVGVAEKGFVSLQLSVRTEGGHSSMPPDNTAVGMLATAIHKLERHQLPRGIRGATAAMLDYLGPEMPFTRRVALANRWLFDPLIERQFGALPEGNAMLRTTTAPTIFHAGVKENVLPSSASAVVNFRILPGDDVASVIEHVRRTIDDPRIEIEPLAFRSEPSPMSDLDSDSFWALQSTVQQIFPDAIFAPYLVVGGTDSRYYTDVTANVYRFNPMYLNRDDFRSVHGTDERVSLEACADMVRFYVQLIRQTVG
jgi:carboxypeptidase PM20D1